MAKSAAPLPLFTIGYERATPDAVLGELKRVGVTLLLDTRAVAASRRQGFSKRQLATSLDENQIGYLHLRALGTPTDGRQAARAGDLDTLWRIYDEHLATAGAQEALDLRSSVQVGRSACSATSATRLSATAAASPRSFTPALVCAWRISSRRRFEIPCV
jgi:uncharacterized protein (DUF488 family)